jgi:hypothetical protein
MAHIPYTHLKRKKLPISAWAERGAKHALQAILTADNDEEIIVAAKQCRDMLASIGISPATVADSVRVGPVEIQIPPELSEDAGNSATILRLILQRHRKAIGLSGEVSLSSAIDRLNRGVDLTNFDMARIRDARARARLAVTVPA